MNIRQIQEAREKYGIDEWSAGYFGINDRGCVVCFPTADESLSVELSEIIDHCKKKGFETPLIIRFPQVIHTQIKRLHDAFVDSIKTFNYGAGHRGVFPFKVNQRREFIDNIVAYGRDRNYGLEVGSKAEMIAALSYELSSSALLICNGFKDPSFIELGFIAARMGKNVLVVVEGPDELQFIIDRAKSHGGPMPQIGFRVRLYSRGSGKWEKSSGSSSKFGLTTIELIDCLQMIEEAGMKNQFQMLHFHIGSQITEIKRIKNAMKEAARVYAKIVKMGFQPTFLNIGGGVGVDYDGSKTSYQSSANYSLQEFANDCVYVIGEVCDKENVKVPEIITESGRVIAAYHSIVATDIREVQGLELDSELAENGTDDNGAHKCLNELRYIYDNINRKNFVEYFHDAVEHYEELFTLFNLGYIKLKERALGEELYQRICRRALFFSTYGKQQLEEFSSLQKQMVSKFLANFSIFQSTPDSWSIDQMFPIMPLSHHDVKPDLKASIVDITCDSDGCIERFIDRHGEKDVLDLHSPLEDEPYHLGFFLVGAYQESLANEHNLFGAINEVEITIDENGDWAMSKLTTGDSIGELLESRNFSMEEIFASYRKQLQDQIDSGHLAAELLDEIMERLKKFSQSLPYLSEKTSIVEKGSSFILRKEGAVGSAL
jgi:arginine decarboxylase